MSLLMPTWQLCEQSDGAGISGLSDVADASLVAQIPPEMVLLEKNTRQFTAQSHWELSTTITTYHLLAIIAIANTLMSMNNASFVAEQERSRKLLR